MFTEVILRFFMLFLSAEDHRLAEVVQTKVPQNLTKETALLHVTAAKLSQTEEIPATLLLSMAYSESRYNPKAVSRVRDGVRRGGIPKWKRPPENVTGPYFCGVTQVAAKMSWKRCVEFRDILLAYRTASHELTNWLNDPYCRKSKERMRCALFGYGGGYPAIKAQTLTYPNRVLGRARAFERAIEDNT